ncbi:DNA-binding transcriptional regulator, LysR family [Quadrisphaera granulorum]|uniref:DNA-binding transcriptional LysR family regulator n=1 Tax=Quadrisphaera granulorum TaxID=317664 RepID=A0A315ZVN3_9ACTN|nr:LysR family transcriptional regulator [Quadrisphaera granulorum]PWJ49575.1 DNA-binding transcriptional LysR family regulator [Quadrisphaera granulorum]SZE98154.1 DNA-binding transcriptional regulator, LysR family [Quadrisphaera granulorum]
MLDVRRLLLLREVAVRGTLAAAAEALSYSPSHVSQQLTLLAKEAGAPLLRRSGRRVVLTAEAEELVAAAGEVLDVLERASARVALASRERAGGPSAPLTGRVRLAVFQSAALALVPGALRQLTVEHPGLRVEVVQAEPGAALESAALRAEASRARDFDVVVAEEYPAHSRPHLPGLVRTELVRDPLRLALPPEHLAPDVHDLADLASGASPLPWVAEPEGTASRDFTEQTCRARGFEPDVRFTSADLQTHLRLVETGCAVAVLPDLVHAGRETSCRLVDLPGQPRRTVFAAQRAAASGQPALAVVVAALRAQVTTP